MTVAALFVSDEVRAAIDAGRPVVALESSLIAQGLPAPHNLETALAAEAAIREAGAIPATTAFQTHLTAGQQSRHGYHRFLGVFRAGANGEHEIAE